MDSNDKTVQCPCGHNIKNETNYNILYLKKELKEIDILCPNSTCYLGELGFIKFYIQNNRPKLKIARFYSPYVTWNATQLGEQKAKKLLEGHLERLITQKINWRKVLDETSNIEY